jgi:Antirestriction protein (ArdA)
MDQITAIYKAWLARTGDTTYEDAGNEDENNAEAWLSSSGAYFGQYDNYTELAEALVDDSGAVEDFWHERDNHSLAPYFKFDYEQYGRDLDLGGDLWSEEIDGKTHWFWSNY